MTALWFLPLFVAVVGLTAVAVAARRSAEEAGRLGDELRRLRGMRPLLLELQATVESFNAARRQATGRRTA